MNVVGIVAPAGGGKDTVYQDLKDLAGCPVDRFALADSLRLEIEAVMGAHCPNLWTKDEEWSGAAEWILQRYGTEFRRDQDPDYWVKATRKRIHDYLATQGVPSLAVVTDVRFPNEVKMIRGMGGMVLYVDTPMDLAVERRPDKDRHHESERMANLWASIADTIEDPEATDRWPFPWDYTIPNRGTLVDLADAVRLFIANHVPQG